MENIQECAKLYKSLIGKDFIFTLGNNVKFKLYFKPSNFHHLLGLGKLTDIKGVWNGNPSNVFKEILDGQISIETIKKSTKYYKIANRVKHFEKTTDMLDKEKSKIIIDFNRDLVSGTELINTKYILYRDISLYDEGIGGYANLTIGEKQNKIYPETFFYEDSKKYISEQILLDIIDIEVRKSNRKR